GLAACILQRSVLLQSLAERLNVRVGPDNLPVPRRAQPWVGTARQPEVKEDDPAWRKRATTGPAINPFSTAPQVRTQAAMAPPPSMPGVPPRPRRPLRPADREAAARGMAMIPPSHSMRPRKPAT